MELFGIRWTLIHGLSSLIDASTRGLRIVRYGSRDSNAFKLEGCRMPRAWASKGGMGLQVAEDLPRSRTCGLNASSTN